MKQQKSLGLREYVIAAAPGWSVFFACEDGNREELILGWQIIIDEASMADTPEQRFSHYPFPITTEGLISEDENDGAWAIKTPLGTYEVQADTTFEDAAECSRYLRERARERKDRERERKSKP